MFLRALSVWVIVLTSGFTSIVLGQAGVGGDDYKTRRERLISEVLIPGGVTDTRVLDAIRRTDRHEFVSRENRDRAYYDLALPIGASQTISSPYIVSVMTQALDTKPEHTVLEIGTGSGYQAAVLSPLVKEVYSIEIVPELGKQAKKVLESLGYKNVFTKVGDGFLGWPEHAPFDRIIVTCSPEDVPKPLVEQLSEGGLMIIPVGERYQQTLYLMRKKDGKLEREALRPTLFVPMTGEAEENRRVQADPTKPTLINGDFEEQPLKTGDIPGWYYQRGLSWLSDSKAGGHYVEFENDIQGRPTNLLQGLGMDGRHVRRIKLSVNVKISDVRQGMDKTELPALTIRFLDEKRAWVGGSLSVGPFQGTIREWKHETRLFRVPAEAREAIVSIGLFGATGKAAFDKVELEAVNR